MSGIPKNPDIDQILKDLAEQDTRILESEEIKFYPKMERWHTEDGNKIVRALHFSNRYGKFIPLHKSKPPIDYLMETLTGFDEVCKKIESSPEEDEITVNSFFCVKCIFVCYVLDLAGGTRDFTDEERAYREEAYKAIKDLPKDNIFRKVFIETYLDEEVYIRFYEDKEKEAGRYDTDEEGENYTPEEAREWDAYYNQICEETDEAEYKRVYDDPSMFYKTVTAQDKLYDKHSLGIQRDFIKRVESFSK